MDFAPAAFIVDKPLWNYLLSETDKQECRKIIGGKLSASNAMGTQMLVVIARMCPEWP